MYVFELHYGVEKCTGTVPGEINPLMLLKEIFSLCCVVCGRKDTLLAFGETFLCC